MNSNEIYVLYGNQPVKMAKEILEAVKLADSIPKDAKIGIKPNLVVAKTPDSGATTHTELIEGVVQYLKEHGFDRIILLEGSWVGDSTQRAFKVCGYDRLTKEYGVPLFDTKHDTFVKRSYGGIDMEVCSKALEVDFLINMPVLKGHCQTSITCALKNMKGCITDREKRHFHSLGLHRPIAYLNKIRCADFVLVDGLCGDLDFEEGGNPVQMNRVIAGTDSVLIDSYAANLMGYTIDEIPYIGIAAKEGVGSCDLDNAEIIELNHDESKTTIQPTRRVKQLAGYAAPKDACSACYGNLIYALNRLEEKGCLYDLNGKIAIGQGYKGVQADGIGIGNCTLGFTHCVKGCPPKAVDIVNFLSKL